MVLSNFFIMNKFLMTGATGQVGAILKHYLLEGKNEVFEINRTSLNSNCFTYEDIFNNNVDNDLIRDCTFIHCASTIDFNVFNSEISYFNTYVTHKLLASLKILGLKKIILISSASLVGFSDKFISEDDIIKPNSVYHLTKFYQEKLIQFFNFDFFYCLRISSPISPFGLKRGLFKEFCDKAIIGANLTIFGKGARIQNYVDIRDLSYVICKISMNKFKSGIYNICAFESYSNLELGRMIIESFDSKSTITFHGLDLEENTKWNFDLKNAVLYLDYSQKISIKQTILDYKYYNS